MNIVGVAACVAGIAHTYIAKKKLVQAAQKAGHNIQMETQGTIGVEDELTSENIKNADIVVLAVDIQIKGKERFEVDILPMPKGRGFLDTNDTCLLK